MNPSFSLPPDVIASEQHGLAVWFAAWVVLIAVGFVLSRSEGGRSVIYYILWLSILLLIVTRSSDIATLFQQGNITQGNT